MWYLIAIIWALEFVLFEETRIFWLFVSVIIGILYFMGVTLKSIGR